MKHLINQYLDREQIKLNSCLRLAKSCVQDWIETGDKRYRTIRREAMQDARYWRNQLTA